MIRVRATTNRFARTTTSGEITKGRTRVLASEGKKLTQGHLANGRRSRTVG